MAYPMTTGKRIQFKKNAALLYEVASIDPQRGLCLLIDPIFSRRRILQLLIGEVEGVDRSIYHPYPNPIARFGESTTQIVNKQDQHLHYYSGRSFEIKFENPRKAFKNPKPIS